MKTISEVPVKLDLPANEAPVHVHTLLPHEQPALTSPYRAGVFETTGGAVEAVCDLLDAGFTKKQITVICSDKGRESPFHEFEHQKISGARTEWAVVCGALTGTALGTLLAITGVMSIGGLGTAATIVILAGVCGIPGAFVGAMLTRGTEKELADFYDQSVLHGRILVAAESHAPNSAEKLATAARILALAGATPIAIPESD